MVVIPYLDLVYSILISRKTKTVIVGRIHEFVWKGKNKGSSNLQDNFLF